MEPQSSFFALCDARQLGRGQPAHEQAHPGVCVCIQWATHVDIVLCFAVRGLRRGDERVSQYPEARLGTRPGGPEKMGSGKIAVPLILLTGRASG